MSNDLIPMDIVGTITTVDDDACTALANNVGYLRRIELKSKGRAIDTAQCKPGSFVIVKSSDDLEDLGNSIDVLVVARRPKAIDMSDKDNLVICYDFSSEVFKDIQQRSTQKNSSCQAGVSFLVIERSTGGLYEFFCGSKSAAREVDNISSYMVLTEEQIKARGLKGVKPHGPLPMTLKSKMAENKKEGWTWFVPVPTPCANPFTKDQVPDPETIRLEVEKFLNPDEPKNVEKTENQRAR